MSAGIAKIDLETITLFQRDLHDPKDENEEITSNFYREFRKTTWYTHIPVKLKCTANENDLIYTANNTFDYLVYTYQRQVFPALRVKKEYRNKVQICWPHNLGTNIVQIAQLKFDDDTPQTIDSIWFDIFAQFYMKPGFRDHYNVCVGNVEFLEKWSDFLPEYTTTSPQPWYYTRDPSQAVPLLYCTMSTITHHYKMRTKITELLRMRVREGETAGWKEIPCNLKYIDGAGSTGTLKTPELWGRYAYLTDEEREWNKCSTERSFYIEDVVVGESINNNSYGANVPVELDCTTPCKALFWVAENLTAQENRNFSNYTTNPDNLYEGWNPITRTSLVYGNSSRLEKMSSDHFDRIEPWYHFPSPPSEAGYNSYSFAMNSTALDAEIGIVMAGIKARLLVTLGNTSPFLKPVRYTDEKNPVIEELEEAPMRQDTAGDKFAVHVRMLVMKKLTFTYNDEKKQYLITV